MAKLPIPRIQDRVAYALGRSTTAATVPGLQGSAVSGSTGGTVANGTTYREVVCVAGHAAVRVRLLTVTSTGTLTVTPIRPEVAPAGVPDEAVMRQDGTFDTAKVVKYTTGGVSKAVAAGVEASVDLALVGENYVLVEFACTATGSITYCDASSIDFAQVVSASTSGSASALGGTSSSNAALITGPGQWAQGSAPAAATVAVSTKAAGAAGVRHVCTMMTATLTTGATAQATAFNIVLRDGVSGSGTVFITKQAILPVNGIWEFTCSGLNIVGSAATAMTVETSTPVAGAFVSVSFSGYDAA